MKRGLAGIVTLVVAAVFTGGCAGPSGSHSEPIATHESTAARARIEELRARFVLPGAPPPVGFGAAMPAPAQPRPALGERVACGFELRDGAVHPVISAEATRGVTRTASVGFPVHAGDPVALEDDTSQVAVSFALRGASDVGVATADGVAIYPGALAGADVLHRVHAEGTEDYFVFEQRPAKEQLAYDVDVTRVAGLRLVSNTLEFLDEGGAPRLRIAPPYVVDANGNRTEGLLALDGCAFDASARAPWGRAVTSPGASRCTVRVAWKAAMYPAMLDPSWTATGSMVTARLCHTATRLGSGQVLMAGGGAGASQDATSTAELYDPTTGTFAATGSMTTARMSCPGVATLLGTGKVLIAGGETIHSDAGAADVTPSAELYDPVAGTFTATGAMTTARTEHSATLLGSGDVLIAGGWNGICAGNGCTTAIFLSSAEFYDPVAGTFASTGAMTTARNHHSATLLPSNKVLIAGGYDGGGVLSSAEVYDPTARTFAATGSMTTPRVQGLATPLASGQVLVVGGADAHGPASSAELYDPTAGTFAATGSMTLPRVLAAATRLVSGHVLVAGGQTSSGFTQSAELYDPSSGTFAATATMTTARFFFTATLLASGEVLAAGGDNLVSAELFTCTATCPAAYNCGTIAACDGTLVSCGTCTAPQTCGGGADGGTPNVCGCAPIACASSCGTMPNGCGGTLDCGGCVAGYSCANNKCVAGGADGGADSGAVGMDAGADSSAISIDSGSSVDTGTSDATDGGGNGGGSGQSSGCSCRMPQTHDGASYALLWLGAVWLVGMRRQRRSTGRRIGR